MYLDTPVKIPEIDGKIIFRQKKEAVYVLYLAGRSYDAERKFNVPEYRIIGRRIEEMPGLMLPNENYEMYFENGKEKAGEKMTEEERRYGEERRNFRLYSDFFDNLYYEMKMQARRNPELAVNEYKAGAINRILEPLREMMAGETYGEFLGLVKDSSPAAQNDKGAQNDRGGMTYGDVMVLMTQYRTALAKYRKSRL